jgi:hypothetical protein
MILAPWWPRPFDLVCSTAVTLRMTRLPFWPGGSHELRTTIMTTMARGFMARRPVMQVARMLSDLRGYLLRVVSWRTVPLASG